MSRRGFHLCFGLSLFGVVFLLLPRCNTSRPEAEWKERGTVFRPHWAVMAVAVAPDGRTAATAETDGTVRLWDLSTLAEKACLPGHTAPPTAVVFSPDGRTLASCGRDRAVRLWDVESGRCRACLTEYCRSEKCLKETGAGAADHTVAVLSVAFAPDGETLAAGCGDGSLLLWEVATGRPRCRPATGHHLVQALAYSPDGRTLATAGLDCQVRLWDTAPADGTPRERAVLRGHTGQVFVVVFAPDGRSLFSAGWDGTVRVWDPETAQERTHWEAVDGQVRSLAVSPDGRTVAAGGSHHTLRLWEASTGTLETALEGHQEWVSGLAFTPDGRGLLSAGGDGMLKVWRLTGSK